jgi:hypothetical protein
MVHGEGTPTKFESDIFRALVRLYPGISYKVSRRLQLESGFSNLLGMNYYHQKGVGGTDISEASGFNMYASIENMGNLYVGFRLLLNK